MLPFRLAVAALYNAVTGPEGGIALFEESADHSCTPGLLVGEHPNLFADCGIVSAGVDVGEYFGGESLQVLVLEDVPVGSFEAILQL